MASRRAHFYEKDAPRYTPDVGPHVDVPRRSGEAVDPLHRHRRPGDAGLVRQHGESRTASVSAQGAAHRPSDGRGVRSRPGEGTDVLTCATVAFWLKEMFDGAGLASFAKVSGSKGMQVYVRSNTAVTYERTQPFASGLARRLEREHPDLVVSEMAKAKRAREGLHRLEPELGFQNHGGGLLAAGEARRAVRLDAGRLGRAAAGAARGRQPHR